MFTKELLKEFFNLEVENFTYEIKGTDIFIYYNLLFKNKPLLDYITFIYNKLEKKMKNLNITHYDGPEADDLCDIWIRITAKPYYHGK